jgi:predicted nucleic acid-binding Zn finger protein
LTEISVPAADRRVERGIRLFRERREEIIEHGDLWTVPGTGTYWTVNPERESCDCPDFRRRADQGEYEPCKHVYAVALVLAKRRSLR